MSAVNRDYPRAFKLEAVRRLLSGTSIGQLARELGVNRFNLRQWRAKYLAGGAEALRGRGARPKGAVASGAPPGGPPSRSWDPVARVAELERKIGQQQLELDFFERALRQVKGSRQPSEGPGATTSTPSSRR